MSRFFLLSIVCSALLATIVASSDVEREINLPADAIDARVYRMRPRNADDYEWLHRMYRDGFVDIWAELPRAARPGEPNAMDVMIKSKYAGVILTRSIARGIEIVGKSTSVEELLEAERRSNEEAKAERRGSIMNTFASYTDIKKWQQSMCDKYKSLATCETIGFSGQNKSVVVITIGSNQTRAGKKAIFIDAGMHAREWISPATMITMWEQWLMDYDSNPTRKMLLDTFNFHLIPVANPDGYEYTMKRVGGDRLWRKTRSRHLTCFGVDANRNFGYRWGLVGSSHNPCSETFLGPAPFSEPETKNIRMYLTNPKRTSTVVAALSIHSYSQMWLLPWSFQKDPKPENYDTLLSAGTHGMRALEEVNGRPWTIGNVADILYPASGDSMDWYLGDAGIKYVGALELRPDDQDPNGFVIPANQIQPSVDEVFAGLAAYAAYIIKAENLH